MNLVNIHFEKERERYIFNGIQSIHKRKNKILFRRDSIYFCFDSWVIFDVGIRKYLINRQERRTYGRKEIIRGIKVLH